MTKHLRAFPSFIAMLLLSMVVAAVAAVPVLLFCWLCRKVGVDPDAGLVTVMVAYTFIVHARYYVKYPPKPEAT